MNGLMDRQRHRQTLSETERLKVRIKKWEKEFYHKNGRKATKSDIDLDSHLKNDYKKYWKSLETKNMNEIWSKTLNKSNTKIGSIDGNSSDVLNSLSKKMFDKYMKDSTLSVKQSHQSFSFKKKLLKQRQQSVDNQNNRQNGGQSTAEDTTTSATIGSEPTLNPVLIRAKSIEESILRSISNEFNHEFNKVTKDQTFIDNNLVNDIIDRIDVINDDNCHQINETVDRSDPTVVSSSVGPDWHSDNASNDSLSLHYLQITPKTGVKRKSDVFDFNDETEDNPQKRRIYADLDSGLTSGHKRSTEESIDSNEEMTTNSDSMEKKKKFFVTKDRTKRLNTTLSSYKLNINPIISENSFDGNGEQINTKIKTKVIESKENDSNVKTIDNKSKDKVKDKVKAKRKAKPKKVENNYKRLDLKHKVFCKGYKRFNIKKYKRFHWKQNTQKNKNNCYKCGASGHWAQECTYEDNPDVDAIDDELKGLGVSKAVEDLQQTIQIKPLLNEESSEVIEHSISEALVLMGHKEFRPNQEQTIKKILSGESCLMISSTGSGKSLCYQLPAYLLWKQRKAITLVISPLISLMEDQMTTFPKCLKPVSIHSGMNPTQKQSSIDSLLSGEAQVILLSPEAITGGNTCINLNALPAIGFVCIDEAHCLSEWSNNFRPSYLQLYRVLKDKLKIRTFLALTATATKKTALTIARTLGLDSQNDIIGSTSVPENLVLTVSRDTNKELALIDLLKSERFCGLKSIIIYCTRREQTERLASLIRISFQDIRKTNPKTGKSRIVWDAQSYHAGMSSDERHRVQKRFITGDLRVIVATIAFGMGINKSDIRGIIHFNLPKSFENYMQEIGRAGRDGLPAHCHLFLDSDGSDLFELQRHIYANSTDRKCLRKLIEKVFKSCKCKTIYGIEDKTDESDGQSDSVCVGHEIAFPIESTVLEMDLKEETIMTLITYLELEMSKEKVKLLSPINSMCTLLCYANGSEQMRALSKHNSIIGMALTLYQKNNSSEEIPNKLKFDLVEVCSLLGRPISQVRQQLRQLEWCELNGRKKRTNVRVMFSDLSFHLRSVGDLSANQLNKCLEFLYDLTSIQETIETSKLRNVFFVFKKYSQNCCTNRFNQTKCLQLKQTLDQYFNDNDIDFESQLISDEKFNQLFAGTHVYDLEQARRDVRDLISIHGTQTLSSARVIARLLQGIPSPRFPADVWGKCRRFWRSDININFNELLKIANEELIALKNV